MIDTAGYLRLSWSWLRAIAVAAAAGGAEARNRGLAREARRGVGAIDIAQADTQEWHAAMRDLAGLDELVGDALGSIDRDGKTKTLGGDALRRSHQRRDAHHLAVDVEKRSARVARIDRRVSLDHRLVVTALTF